jgi:DNA-binding GntR family transcriptional regulator
MSGSFRAPTRQARLLVARQTGTYDGGMNDGSSPNRALSRNSLADLVYNQLSRDILSGALSLGETLSEAALAIQFRVSRGPVREALQRLASDGLVHNQANRKATVVQLSTEDIAQIYRVRELLEGGAAEEAAKQMEEAELASLAALIERAKTLLEGPDPSSKTVLAELVDLDVQFHRIIAEGARNSYLLREIDRYHRLIRVTQRRGVTTGTQETAWTAHRRIFGLLFDRDPSGARLAMALHIRAAYAIARDAQ